MSKVYEPTEAQIVAAEKADPRIQYYRPLKKARIRNPEDRGIVPAYGVRITRNHSMWARYTRQESCERIDRKRFLEGREKALKAQQDEAKKAAQAEAKNKAKDASETAPEPKSGNKTTGNKGKQ